MSNGLLKRAALASLLVIFLSASVGRAGFLDDLLGSLEPAVQGTSEDTAISGLKEALSTGTVNAVMSVSQLDGYLGNQMVKILMPEKIKMVADTLAKVGFQQQVDDFVTSMNRAAEKAAPQAKSFFLEAITAMTIEDAMGILNGGDTAATDYLKEKTTDQLYETFKPVIESSLNDVGGTRYFNEMMKSFTSLPFMTAQSLDLNHYVTEEALDGLFLMIGQEEKKIRTDPAARVTDLLQKVFTK